MARRGYSPLASFEGTVSGAPGRNVARASLRTRRRASSGRRLAAPRVRTPLAFRAGGAFTGHEPISDVPCRRSGTAASAPIASLVAMLLFPTGSWLPLVSPRTAALTCSARTACAPPREERRTRTTQDAFRRLPNDSGYPLPPSLSRHRDRYRVRPAHRFASPPSPPVSAGRATCSPASPPSTSCLATSRSPTAAMRPNRLLPLTPRLRETALRPFSHASRLAPRDAESRAFSRRFELASADRVFDVFLIEATAGVSSRRGPRNRSSDTSVASSARPAALSHARTFPEAAKTVSFAPS